MSDLEKIISDAKKPGLPNDQRKRLWTLYYHYSTSVPLMKNFEFAGSMIDAKKRAIAHCDMMGYRFIKVRPLLVDLEEQEKRKSHGEDVEEG